MKNDGCGFDKQSRGSMSVCSSSKTNADGVGGQLRYKIREPLPGHPRGYLISQRHFTHRNSLLFALKV